MKRVGIFGGSFDPVHMGHLYLASEAREQLKLDKMIFVPVKVQPFKLEKHPTEGRHRMAMIRLAIFGNEGLDVSDFELMQEDVSYTINTLRHFREVYGADCKIYFLTGTDAILKIERWKDSRELLENFSYIIGTRPGYREDELKECITRIENTYGTEIVRVHNTQIELSSTEIRKELSLGKSVDGMLPPAVNEYIKSRGLYTEK